MSLPPTPEQPTEPVPSPVLRPRYQGHTPFNTQVRADWLKLVASHPDGFDALLYVPAPEGDPNHIPDYEEEALFGSLEDHQRTIGYLDPVVVGVMAGGSESAAFLASFGADDTLGESEEGMEPFLIATATVPEGSILEFQEETSGSEPRRVWWYVHHSDVVGTAAVGAIHYCIPCADLEQAKAGVTP